MPPNPAAAAGQSRALWMSTIAFTVCFAVWTIFAIIGIQIKRELNLNETQFGLLVGTPILSGSLIRIALGVWTDQYGGRIVYTQADHLRSVLPTSRGGTRLKDRARPSAFSVSAMSARR